MRLHTVTTKVYTWNELGPEAQEKAITEWRDGFEYDYYTDLDYHTEWLAARGFIEAEISYSGFYSQGDGASFTADVDLEVIFNYMVYQSTSWDDVKHLYHFLELKRRDLIDFTVWAERNSHHYSHENTCGTSHELDPYHDGMEYLAAGITEQIDDLRHEFSQDVYHALQADYEYQQSDECITDMLMDNEFTIKGDMYYE